jgi:outer membrane protein assembly factor BamB
MGLGFAIAGQGAAVADGLSKSAIPVVTTTELATFHGNIRRQGYSPLETAINGSNVASLRQAWTVSASSVVSDQPTVYDGVAYWGDWAGNEHATSAKGASLWVTQLGTTHNADCDPSTVGVASSATVGTVNGTQVVVTGGGNATVAELNASTGKVIWDTRIGTQNDAFVWSSPALYDGSVYIGMSSFGDCPLVPSGVFMLNAATGAIEHEFQTVPATPPGCLGGGVWSSPAIDPAENAVFVTTGNTTCTTNLQDAMLKLSATNLSLESSWAIPLSQRVYDSDWGSTPTLFTAEINGRIVEMVGSADKNGIFYALDRTDLAKGPLWEYRIAKGGDCPLCGDGSIAPAAWDGTTLFVAGGHTTVGSTGCPGSVDALDPATGQPVWRDCMRNGPVVGALTEAPGLLFATDGSDLVALDVHNGGRLFLYGDPSGKIFYSGPTVAGGQLYAANTDGTLFAFGPPEAGS